MILNIALNYNFGIQLSGSVVSVGHCSGSFLNRSLLHGSFFNGSFFNGCFLNRSFLNGSLFDGSFFGAAGNQADDHNQCQQQCKQFLHFDLLL